jgi:hypothetical protein
VWKKCVDEGHSIQLLVQIFDAVVHTSVCDVAQPENIYIIRSKTLHQLIRPKFKLKCEQKYAIKVNSHCE